jgi:hypothetical protein
MPSCNEAQPCAALDIGALTGGNLRGEYSGCDTVGSGETCHVNATCDANRYAVVPEAEFRCRDRNDDSNQQPLGTMPECLDIVPCTGGVQEANAFESNNYMIPGGLSIPSGSSSEIACGAGYVGPVVNVSCPANNVDNSAMAQLEGDVSSLTGNCLEMVACANLAPRAGVSGVESDDITGCQGLASGTSCTVNSVCSAGYVINKQVNATAAPEGVFGCPADNTDASTVLTGTWPTCSPCDPGAYFDDVRKQTYCVKHNNGVTMSVVAPSEWPLTGGGKNFYKEKHFEKGDEFESLQQETALFHNKPTTWHYIKLQGNA